MRAREDYLDRTGLLANVQNHRSNALIWKVRFSRDLLSAGKNRFGATQFDDQRPAFPTNSSSGDDLPLAIEVFLVNASAFSFANPLDHHLLGCLSCDPAKLPDVHLFAFHSSANIPALAIDGNRYVFDIRIGLSDSGEHCGFEIFEYRFSDDVLVPGDAFDDA